MNFDLTYAAVAILALVSAQRLAELWISNRNTKWLLAHGGYEVATGHYPLIVAVHTLWLASLWWLAPGQPISLALLCAYGLVQILRAWVLWALGRRWTTRIIIVPGETLVKRGPYRFVHHPNYWVVTAEIALLPLVFGLWQVAILFSLLNAFALFIRIRAENRALGRP